MASGSLRGARRALRAECSRVPLFRVARAMRMRMRIDGVCARRTRTWRGWSCARSSCCRSRCSWSPLWCCTRPCARTSERTPPRTRRAARAPPRTAALSSTPPPASSSPSTSSSSSATRPCTRATLPPPCIVHVPDHHLLQSALEFRVYEFTNVSVSRSAARNVFNLLASATYMFEHLAERQDRAGQAWRDRMLALQQTGITLQYCNHVCSPHNHGGYGLAEFCSTEKKTRPCVLFCYLSFS